MTDSMASLADLRAHEWKVHSQGGEDGVLEEIFRCIGATTRFFVEFGAWDGMHLSNTANLRLAHGWTGLLMEGSDRADGQIVRRERVDAENVGSGRQTLGLGWRRLGILGRGAESQGRMDQQAGSFYQRSVKKA